MTALEAINALLDANPQTVEPRVDEVRSELLKWCWDPGPPVAPIAPNAMRFLTRTARSGDVDVVIYCVGKWVDGLYNGAPPHEWIKRVYKLAPADLRAALYALLVPEVSSWTQNRVVGILDMLRGEDRLRAQEDVDPGHFFLGAR